MAQQLIPRDGADHGKSIAVSTVRVSSTFAAMMVEFRHAWRIPSVVAVAAVTMLFPSVYGFCVAGSYDLRDQYDFFGLMLDDWFPALFPVFVTALHLPRLSDELANGFSRAIMARAPLLDYLRSRLAAGALVAFVVLFTAVGLTCFTAFVVNESLGLVRVAMPINTVEVVEYVRTRSTFSVLYGDPPIGFALVYSAWVGLSAALFSLLGGMCLILLGNRFLALAVPTIVYWGADYPLAVAGLEEFTLIPSIFPDTIAQQPWWHPLVPVGMLLLVLLGLAEAVRRRGADAAGLE